MEAFAKADDERDFYLDRVEGFIIYVDLDRQQEELDLLYTALNLDQERYIAIPKLTFYETKKIMEGFVNEKVYDIDTKERLLDIIQSKQARENFLEFLYDQHTEFEKWQQYYQERSRIRIVEWLRNHHFQFVFEEDLDLPKATLEKVKLNLFQATKVAKDVVAARKSLSLKAKGYYSNEALNPRPKRGRPPKQTIKQEIEPQLTADICLTAPSALRPFIFNPQYGSSAVFTFSSKFESEEDLLASRRAQRNSGQSIDLADFNSKLASLRSLSSHWLKQEAKKEADKAPHTPQEASAQTGSLTPPAARRKSKAASARETAVVAKETSRIAAATPSIPKQQKKAAVAKPAK